MHTDTLRRAYAEFIEAATRGTFAPPASGGWSADMVLAHVIVGDRLIAEAAARVMAGDAPHFDNAASQSEPYLRAVIQAAAGWDHLVDTVRQGGDELMALAQQLTDAQAAIGIPARVVSGNSVILDAVVPVESLLSAPANVHLHAHAEQLAALAAPQPAAVR